MTEWGALSGGTEWLSMGARRVVGAPELVVQPRDRRQVRREEGGLQLGPGLRRAARRNAQ